MRGNRAIDFSIFRTSRSLSLMELTKVCNQIHPLTLIKWENVKQRQFDKSAKAKIRSSLVFIIQGIFSALMSSACTEWCALELHPVPAERSCWRISPWLPSPILALSCDLGSAQVILLWPPFCPLRHACVSFPRESSRVSAGAFHLWGQECKVQHRSWIYKMLHSSVHTEVINKRSLVPCHTRW